MKTFSSNHFQTSQALVPPGRNNGIKGLRVKTLSWEDQVFMNPTPGCFREVAESGKMVPFEGLLNQSGGLFSWIREIAGYDGLAYIRNGNGFFPNPMYGIASIELKSAVHRIGISHNHGGLAADNTLSGCLDFIKGTWVLSLHTSLEMVYEFVTCGLPVILCTKTVSLENDPGLYHYEWQ